MVRLHCLDFFVHAFDPLILELVVHRGDFFAEGSDIGLDDFAAFTDLVDVGLLFFNSLGVVLVGSSFGAVIDDLNLLLG